MSELLALREPRREVRFVRDIFLTYFMAMVFATKWFQFFRINTDSLQSDDVAGSPFVQTFLFLNFGFSIVVFVLTRYPIQVLLRQLSFFFPMMLLIMASTMWSDVPDLALRRVMRLAIEITTVCLLISSYPSARQIYRVLLLACVPVLLADILLLWDAGSYSPIGFMGAHNHKNQAGTFAFLVSALAAYALSERGVVRNKLLVFMILMMALVVMFRSESKTALAAIAFASISTALTYWVYWAFRLRLASAIFFFLLFFILSLLYLQNDNLMLIDGLIALVGGDLTLTGRDVIWKACVERSYEALLYGVGYGSFWGLGNVSEQWVLGAVGFEVRQAHNGYLDIVLQLGVIGLVVLVLVVGRLFGKVNRDMGSSAQTNMKLFSIFMLFGISFYNITESIWFRAGNDLWLLFVIIAATTVRSEHLTAEVAKPVQSWKK